MGRIKWTALVCAAAGAGCSAAGTDTPEGLVITDSAGVRIVAHAELDLSRDLLASLEPVLEIGVIEGAEEYQLFQVSDVTRLPDGRVAVANAGSREVRIYGADGVHLVTVGGAGQGPAEFRYPAGVWAAEDGALSVQDMMDVVQFAPDGSYLDRTSMDRERFAALWGPSHFSEFGAWTPAGRLLAAVMERQQPGERPPPGPPFRPPTRLALVHVDLSAVDTVGDYGGVRQQYVEVGGRRGVMPIVPPFSANTSWAVGAADGTVAIGDNAHPEVHLFGPDGAKTIVRWAHEPEPIAGAEVDAWLDTQRSASWIRGREAEMERAWAQMELPDHKAFYGQVALGGDGHLWIAASSDFGADPAVLLGFGPDGVYRGTVTVPGRFRVHDAGADWLLGVHYDPSEVEFVRMYRLREGGP